MSRPDDPGIRANDHQLRDRTSPLDASVDVRSPLELSRNSARAEMERFRGIAEYEIRKIFGQRSMLKQPVDGGPPKKTRRKKAHVVEPSSGRLDSLESGPNQEDPAEGQDQATPDALSAQTELDFEN